LVGAEEGFDARHGSVTARTVFVRVPAASLLKPSLPITFTITAVAEDQAFSGARTSVFMGPSR